MSLRKTYCREKDEKNIKSILKVIEEEKVVNLTHIKERFGFDYFYAYGILNYMVEMGLIDIKRLSLSKNNSMLFLKRGLCD